MIDLNTFQDTHNLYLSFDLELVALDIMVSRFGGSRNWIWNLFDNGFTCQRRIQLLALRAWKPDLWLRS